MIDVFYLDSSLSHIGWNIIQNHLDQISMPRIKTSIHVLEARLIGMTYEEYLDFCQDSLGAQVVRSEGQKYALIYFRNNEQVRRLVNLLNQKFKESYDFYQK